MAVFYDTKRHRWLVRVRINDHHIQKSFTLKATAEKKERQLLIKKDDISLRGYNPDITMGQLMDLYEKTNMTRLRNARQQHYLLNVFRSEFPTEKAINFNRPRIIAFRNILLNRIHRGRKISEPTCNRYMACLSSVFQCALESGLVAINPVRGVKKYPEPVADAKFLSPVEYETLYGVASDWMKPILAVLVGTGMRISELIGLTWEQINFERESITFQRHKTSKTTGPKVISMSKLAKETLFNLKKTDRTGLVFTHRGKKLSNYGYLRGEMNRTTKKAGLTGVSFHTMRHTCASWLTMASHGDMALVKKQLGHSSLSVTQRYANLSEDYQRMGVKSLDKFLDENKSKKRLGFDLGLG